MILFACLQRICYTILCTDVRKTGVPPIPIPEGTRRNENAERKYHKEQVRNSKMNRVYIGFKYVTDFLLAIIGVAVTAPIMLAVAIAIKAEDGGPVLFTQRRTGAGGKKFNCYKFRSMTSTDVSYDKEKRVISEDNPNVTRVGRVIRKFKLDELPQLFNVIKGDMCFIAPRPLLPVFDTDYEDWEMVKFEMRPGMTGLGQIYGNGHLSIKDRKYYDVYYVMHASLWLDIQIALKTVGVVLFGERRYLRPVSEQEYRRLKREVRRRYTVSPDTVAQLRPSSLS